MRLAPTAVALLVGCLSLRAQGADQPADLPVGVTVRVISVPISIGRGLVGRLSNPNKRDAAFAELDRLIEEREVELLDIAIAWADKGRLSASTSGLLVRYPIQEPVQMPGVGGQAQNPAAPLLPPIMRSGVITPTGHEIRATGLDFQVRTIGASNNSQVTVGIISRETVFAGFTEHRGLTSPIGVTGLIVRPIFKQQTVYTTITTELNRDALLGTYVDESGDRIVIHTVRATITH